MIEIAYERVPYFVIRIMANSFQYLGDHGQFFTSKNENITIYKGDNGDNDS